MLELPSSHPSAKHAVRALASLTASPEGADQAALRGAPGRLVKLIRDYGADEDTKLNAMTALGNLAAWEETTKDVEAAGGPRAIVRTLRESPASSPVAAEAARALANISLSGEDSPRIKHSNRSLSPPRTGYSSPASSSLKKRTASSSMKRVMAETRASTARRPLHLGPWIPPAQPNYLSRNTSPPPSPIPGRQTLNAYRTLSPGRTRARSTSPGRLRGELAIPGIVSGSLRATQALDTLRSSGELYPSPDSSLSIPEIVSMLGGSQQSAVRAASAFTNMSPTEAEKDHLCRLGGAEALVRLLDSGIDSQVTPPLLQRAGSVKTRFRSSF